ncbi:MAG: BIG2 domain-containing protein [Oscillospiraceae bacterium]
MIRYQFTKKTMRLTVAMMLTVFALGARTAVAAFAATEDSAIATENFPNVTLAANTSYISDSYFGILNLSVDDNSVAYATVDSENRVVITATGEGAATVQFWYKETSTDEWVAAVVPITVSGTSDTAQTVTASQIGLVFPQQSISMNVGANHTISGITLNGTVINSETLLWISSSDSVATVDRDSGEIHAVSEGTTKVYAVDPVTNSCASVTVIVN